MVTPTAIVTSVAHTADTDRYLCQVFFERLKGLVGRRPEDRSANLELFKQPPASVV